MIPSSSTQPQSFAHPTAPAWAGDPASPRLGRFVLGPELGRGGMGVVHLAWDPMLRRLLALKQLLQADPTQAMRFMREAQIQAKVEHPRICKVFEVDSQGGQPFIAMQYIKGQTLGEAREHLSIEAKAGLMADVAGAIHAAHRMGLVHRDLKPSNILLEAQEDGRCLPFILDFGLARDQSQADLTLSWGFVGTPAFMSPEQAQSEEPLPTSDIYSLGATFYALFSGHPPHEATTLAGLIHQQAMCSIRPLKQVLPGFPKDLDTILLTCLDLEPAKRYGSAFDLEEDLRRWLAGEPIHAHAIGPLGRAWRTLKRHRRLSASIAAGLCVAFSLLAWNAFAAQRARVQMELVQRFGLQVREVEQLLRIERMLPVHDIRPAEAQVRQRMAEVQATMNRLGTISQGPGHYALGRGHLVLGEFPAAQNELEAALGHGFLGPEVSYALGSALLEQYITTRNTQPTLSEAENSALRKRLVAPALEHFRQSVSMIQEGSIFGEAQIAYLEGDFTKCVAKCQETFRLRPWLYEAKLMEARGWNALFGEALGLGSRLVDTRDQKRADQAMMASGAALEAALAIAPSDERIYTHQLVRLVGASVRQSDSGTPSEELFLQSEELYARAMRVRPDSLETLNTWGYSRVRHGLVCLRAGKDVRTLMRDSLALVKSFESRMRAGAMGPTIGWLHWLLAEGQFRRGQDPRPEFEAMATWFRPDSLDLAQPMATKAEYLASRGLDPRPTLDQAETILTAQSELTDKSFYYHVIWCHVLLARADWEMSVGLDPLAALDRGLAHAERSTRLNPQVVYAPFFLTQFRTRRAQALMGRGLDPGPDLQLALAAGRQGRLITDSHFRLHLALAEAHRVQATHLLNQGLDPAFPLTEARKALAKGLAINPTDFREHHQSALVELLAAQSALNRGESPLSLLAKAEVSAQRGLRTKADDPNLRLAMARVRRFRAAWAKHQGLPYQSWIADGLDQIRLTLSIHPTLVDALAERTSLEQLRDG